MVSEPGLRASIWPASPSTKGMPMGLRVLVCGSRDYTNQQLLSRTLDSLHAEHGIDVIIEGGASGADKMAMAWGRRRRVYVQTFAAQWNVYGHRAGPVRNQQMLDQGKPDLVLAFAKGLLADSRGTADMVRRARAAHLDVRVFHGPTA